MAKDKRQRPRRGEYCAWPLRKARLHSGINPFADEPCGSMPRRPPAVLPPPPFPSTPNCTLATVFHRAAPPSRRGENACAPSILQRSSPSTKFPAEPIVWPQSIVATCSTADAQKRVPPPEVRLSAAPWTWTLGSEGCRPPGSGAKPSEQPSRAFRRCGFQPRRRMGDDGRTWICSAGFPSPCTPRAGRPRPQSPAAFPSVFPQCPPAGRKLSRLSLFPPALHPSGRG